MEHCHRLKLLMLEYGRSLHLHQTECFHCLELIVAEIDHGLLIPQSEVCHHLASSVISFSIIGYNVVVVSKY